MQEKVGIASHLKLKIVILVPAFPPKILGGMEIATYNIAKYLVKRGHEVHVITVLDKGLPKKSMEEGFYVHRIALQKVHFIGILLYWIKMLFLLKKINPDIVHAQNIDVGIAGFLEKCFLKKPYVVYGRGTDVYSSWTFKKPISKMVFKNAGAVIALTQDMKREMKKICSRDIFVVPNGIDLERFKNLSKETIQKSLKIANDKKIIVFVGRLHFVKGIKYAIEAMKIIRQKNTDIKLMIVGDGADREKLKILVNKLDLDEVVTFIGRIPFENIPNYLIASDVLVLPSLTEGFPNTILEGMASGLPIVTTNVGGIPEIVKNGENGFLVKPRNSKEIAEKVLLLLENNALRKTISEKNREVAKGYSWEDVVEKLEKIYLSLHYMTL